MKRRAWFFGLSFGKETVCVLDPLVMISPRPHHTVIATPGSTHTAESWEETRETIKKTYISECIFGKFGSKDGRYEGVSGTLEFFERHPEWDCVCQKGHTVQTWNLVE